MAANIDKDKLEKLLGKTISVNAGHGLEEHLSVTESYLELMICSLVSGSEETQALTFKTRNGYSAVNTPIFRGEPTIKVDGVTVSSSKYELVATGTKLPTEWYNSIVFNDRKLYGNKVKVTALWGFEALPDDLALVFAGIFDVITTTGENNTNIKSKKVEDFAVTFVDLESALDDVKRKYSIILSKYSCCDEINFESGDVLDECI